MVACGHTVHKTSFSRFSGGGADIQIKITEERRRHGLREAKTDLRSFVRERLFDRAAVSPDVLQKLAREVANNSPKPALMVTGYRSGSEQRPLLNMGILIDR